MDLTSKQKEQLIILAEECAEVQQCVAKLLRFGIQNDYTSLDDLKKELGDILGIMDWVVTEFDIDPELLIQYGKAKQEKMLKWTSHQSNKSESGASKRKSGNSKSKSSSTKKNTSTTKRS